jgi:hypothetical protein
MLLENECWKVSAMGRQHSADWERPWSAQRVPSSLTETGTLKGNWPLSAEEVTLRRLGKTVLPIHAHYLPKPKRAL